MYKGLVFLFVALVTQGCCSIPQMATRVPASAEFVGKIELGKAIKSNGNIRIPASFLGGEWGQNSALMPCNLYARVEVGVIFVKVDKCLVSNSSCFNNEYFELRSINPGIYKVVYLGPSGAKSEIGRYTIE